MKVKFKGLSPKYMSEGAAGADLCCCGRVEIPVGEEVLVKTGAYIQIPDGHFGMLVPRSSTCRKFKLELTNSVGIIDSDYRGELKLSYRNIGTEAVTIEAGSRIGQIIFKKYEKADFVLVDNLDQTIRGSGGFGSTDK